jgi:hypothetical protein
MDLARQHQEDLQELAHRRRSRASKPATSVERRSLFLRLGRDTIQREHGDLGP